MAFEQKQKEKALESLMDTNRLGQITEINLRFQGKINEAEKVWQENSRLSAEIDILIGQIMDEWLDDAQRVIKNLARIKAEVETAVDKIKRKIDVAQNVVKIIGLLDEAVAIAKKVVAGI